MIWLPTFMFTILTSQLSKIALKEAKKRCKDLVSATNAAKGEIDHWIAQLQQAQPTAASAGAGGAANASLSAEQCAQKLRSAKKVYRGSFEKLAAAKSGECPQR